MRIHLLTLTSLVVLLSLSWGGGGGCSSSSVACLHLFVRKIKTEGGGSITKKRTRIPLFCTPTSFWDFTASFNKYLVENKVHLVSKIQNGTLQQNNASRPIATWSYENFAAIFPLA